MPSIWLIWAFITVFQKSHCFNIGALFHEDETSMMLHSFLAVSDTTGLTPIYKQPAANSSIDTQDAVCGLLSESVVAIIGPLIGDSSPIVQSICDSKEIPNIQARYTSSHHRSSCMLNFYPHPSALSKAYADVVRVWGWKSFYIIYEDNESLIRISNLLEPDSNNGAIVRITQLDPFDNFRPMFRQIKSEEEKNIFLDCSINKLPEVLKQAQQIGLMIAGYNYIITCLDFHTLDLEQYKYSGVNITGFRLINPDSNMVIEATKNWSFASTKFDSVMTIYEPDKILVEAALIYDAANLFGQTVQEYGGGNLSFEEQEPIDVNEMTGCDDEKSWKFGYSLINSMKVTEYRGLTGLIKFDNEGYRTNVEFQIVELTEDGIQVAGILNTTCSDIKIIREVPTIVESQMMHDFQNYTFKVIISLTKPYGMRKPLPAKQEGNARYEGYAVELIQELSMLYNFKYEILIDETGQSGSRRVLPNGTDVWDGMIGKVLNKTADLAISDLTMSEERAQAVEFSSPFMDLGIAILYIQPEKEHPSLFSFFFPFSTEVWLMVVTAYIGVSLQFYIMARISPYEWINPYPCIEEPEELENQFTLNNAFWFTIGALMQQGTEIAPISTSTRMAAGFWWFFTLIMVSSYTANLAAFLTVENEVSPFKDATELARQNVIKYGAKKGGTTVTFFKESKNPDYQKLYEVMIECGSECLMKDNEAGVKKVLSENGKFAFFMESSSIEYEKEQHCELYQIGKPLDSKNYAIAMRKDSWYASSISKGVLVLQEKGILTNLKRKWWKEKYSKNCQEDEKNEATTLELSNVGGVFLVLLAGLATAFLIMLYELCTTLKTTAKEEDGTLKEELTRELKFIMKCTSIKPVRKPDERSLMGSRSETNNSFNNGYDIRNRLKALNSESQTTNDESLKL